MKRFFSLLLLPISLLTVFASCSKDKGNTQAPEADPVLLLQFPGAYLQAGQIDSAQLVWKEGAESRQVKFTQRNDSLFIPLRDLPDGPRSYELLIFAQKRYANQYQGIWKKQQLLSLPASRSITVAAPASFTDTDWKPRTRLKDAIGHEAIIALRPDDPYFFIFSATHSVQNYVLERTYWSTIGGPRAVASKTWECKDGCVNRPNETFFTDFVQRIGTQPWNHISVVVLFETDANGLAWLLTLEWEP